MQWIIFKYAITAGLVVLISEIAKRSDKLGGLIAAITNGDGINTDLAFYGKPDQREDCQSCLVHLLVCCSHITYVLGFSLVIKTL